jgi:hypothetical protein
LGEKLTEERNNLDELTSKEKRLKLAGFGEEELQNLFEVAQENHSHPRSKLVKKEAVQALVTEKTEALAVLRTDEREREKVQKEIDAEQRIG